MADNTFPQAGDRCGFVCGPCDSPRDAAGTVLTVYGDRHDHIALVLMDDGSGTETVVGSYTTAGIGCHLIRRAGVPA